MAKKVIWSTKAAKERKDILSFWVRKNGDKRYSSKLDVKFKETIRNIADLNYLGKDTGYRGIRVTIVESYMIFYSIKETVIEIVTIFDSRRNPDDLAL